MLKPIVLVVMGLTGWALGRTRPAVNFPFLALTLFAAVTAHSMMQSAFVEARLHEALGDPRNGANEAVVILIAAGEAAGLWVPFLAVPWTRFSARVWGSPGDPNSNRARRLASSGGRPARSRSAA